MLKLTQTLGDSIYIFDGDGRKILRITYVNLGGKQISLGFEADNDITIIRDKVLFNKTRDEINSIITQNKHNRIDGVDGNLRNPNDTIFFIDGEEEKSL